MTDNTTEVDLEAEALRIKTLRRNDPRKPFIPQNRKQRREAKALAKRLGKTLAPSPVQKPYRKSPQPVDNSVDCST